MIRHWIDRQAQDLGVALGELGLELRQVTQLGRADRREVLGMRKQNAPRIAEPFVKLDDALGGLCLKVRRFVANSQ